MQTRLYLQRQKPLSPRMSLVPSGGLRWPAGTPAPHACRDCVATCSRAQCPLGPLPPASAWTPSGAARSGHGWWPPCGSRTLCLRSSGQGETLVAEGSEGQEDRGQSSHSCQLEPQTWAAPRVRPDAVTSLRTQSVPAHLDLTLCASGATGRARRPLWARAPQGPIFRTGLRRWEGRWPGLRGQQASLWAQGCPRAGGQQCPRLSRQADLGEALSGAPSYLRWPRTSSGTSPCSGCPRWHPRSLWRRRRPPTGRCGCCPAHDRMS